MTERDHIGHLETDTPWGNAGGVIKTIEELEYMARTGVGWLEAGSYTLDPRPSNSPNGEQSYYHDPETGETFNSLGMPNQGIDALEADIQNMVHLGRAFDKEVIFNVAPVSTEPEAEAAELVDRIFAAGGRNVLLNASCPNVITEEGGRHELLSNNPRKFVGTLQALSKVTDKYNRMIFVRPAPFETYQDALSVMTALRGSGIVSAVFTTNTFPGHKPVRDGRYVLEVEGNQGGLSGPATARAACQQTSWAVKALEGSQIDVVSSQGIMTGEELKKRLWVGAVAGAGTTLYYEAAEEGAAEATDRLIRQYVEAAMD